jgi:hypothetical protein
LRFLRHSGKNKETKRIDPTYHLNTRVKRKNPQGVMECQNGYATNCAGRSKIATLGQSTCSTKHSFDIGPPNREGENPRILPFRQITTLAISSAQACNVAAIHVLYPKTSVASKRTPVPNRLRSRSKRIIPMMDISVNKSRNKAIIMG